MEQYAVRNFIWKQTDLKVTKGYKKYVNEIEIQISYDYIQNIYMYKLLIHPFSNIFVVLGLNLGLVCINREAQPPSLCPKNSMTNSGKVFYHLPILYF